MLLNYIFTVYFCILKNIAIFLYNIFEISESDYFYIFFTNKILYSQVLLNK